MNSFYQEYELKQFGFKSVGKNVLISRKCSIYGANNISIGNNVRIDDFCILSGKIELGNYIHISAYTALYGGKTGIKMEDFSGISSRCAVYAETDDYVNGFFANAMIPDEYRNVISGHVLLKKNVIVGSGCTILPGVILDEGASVGSMSLVNKGLEQWTVNVGIPCRKIKDRKKISEDLEKKLLKRI